MYTAKQTLRSAKVRMTGSSKRGGKQVGTFFGDPECLLQVFQRYCCEEHAILKSNTIQHEYNRQIIGTLPKGAVGIKVKIINYVIV